MNMICVIIFMSFIGSKQRFSSDQRSEATLSLLITQMHDRLEIPGTVSSDVPAT